MISIGKITHNGMKKVNKIVKIIVKMVAEYLTKKIKVLFIIVPNVTEIGF